MNALAHGIGLGNMEMDNTKVKIQIVGSNEVLDGMIVEAYRVEEMHSEYVEEDTWRNLGAFIQKLDHWEKGRLESKQGRDVRLENNKGN